MPLVKPAVTGNGMNLIRLPRRWAVVSGAGALAGLFRHVGPSVLRQAA